MAKALIAAIVLAVVLVAAVVVPMALTPGVYGFDDWPEAKPATPHEQIVSLEVPAVRAVRAEPKRRATAPRAVAPHRELASAAPAPTHAPTAVRGTPQIQPQTAVPAQPQAAPEQPQAAPVVDARDHSGDVPTAIAAYVQPARGADGTNRP
jgi:hypothetical protein